MNFNLYRRTDVINNVKIMKALSLSSRVVAGQCMQPQVHARPLDRVTSPRVRSFSFQSVSGCNPHSLFCHDLVGMRRHKNKKVKRMAKYHEKQTGNPAPESTPGEVIRSILYHPHHQHAANILVFIHVCNASIITVISVQLASTTAWQCNTHALPLIIEW